MKPVVITFAGSGDAVDLAAQVDYAFPHVVQRAVLPVILVRQQENGLVHAEPLGTGFCLAPGLLVTATHILDPVRGHLDAGTVPPGTDLFVVFVTDQPVPGHSGPWGGPLRVQEVNFNRAHDLAVLSFEFPTVSDEPPQSMGIPITDRTPRVGASVLALGYAQSTVSLEPTSDVVQLDHKVMASQGTMEEAFIPRRDSVMVHFPAIRGTHPSLSGMSGGPVITEEGHVCAAVSTSIEPGEDGAWTSYASLLAPLFALTVDAVVDDGVRRRWSIKELAEAGVIRTDGSDKTLSVHPEPSDEITIRWDA